MKKLFWLPVCFAIFGGALLGLMAYVNMKSTGFHVTAGMLKLPFAVGALGGFILGFVRKKVQEKSAQIDASAAELERHLDKVRTQRELSDNLQRMVDGIPLPVYLKDIAGNYLMANAQYETLAGKTWQEIEGKTDYDVFPDPVAELFREQDDEVLKNKSSRTFEETVPLPGGIVTFQTFKFPLLDDDGNIYAVGGVCTDITKLKEAEDRLASRQERLDVVLRHSREGVIATDSQGLIEMFNAKAEELTGHSAKAAIGRDLGSVYQPRDMTTGAEISALQYSAAGHLPQDEAEREVMLKTMSGQSRPMIQKKILLLDRFGQDMGFLFMFRPPGREELTGKDTPLDSQTRDEHSGLETTGPGQTPAPKARVLIMDDDPLVRKTIGLMLAAGGYDSLNAPDGENAVRLYAEMMNSATPVDVVIMDLTVPGAMGGVEATKLILEMDPKARIMVASGYSNNPVMADYRDYGFLARMEKPYVVEKLTQALEKILRGD
jgi:PAS domain S-box-containing protein